MPITKLTLENFKGVGERVEIPLRPVTLLFGANSAGKSTILQALLYFRHLLNHGSPDTDRIEGGDDSIRLGGFASFVHRADLSRIVKIGVEIPVDGDGLPTYVATDSDGRYDEEIELRLPFVDKIAVELWVRWDAGEAGAYLSGWQVSVNGRLIAEVQGLFGTGLNGHLTFFDLEHPACNDSPERIEDEFEKLRKFGSYDVGPWLEEFRTALDDADQYKESTGFYDYYSDQADFLRGLFGRENLYPGPAPFVAGKGFPWVIPSPEYLSVSFPTDPWECPALSSLLRHVFLGSRKLLIDELERFRYIGPTRVVPDFSALPGSKLCRWSDGSLGWHQFRDAEVTKRVNEALCEKNGIGLGFRVQRSVAVSLPLDGEEWSWFTRIKSELDSGNLDFDAAENVRSLMERIESLPQSFRIDLIDENSGQRRRPADVGVGVSYVIPVVVGAIAPGYSTLLVEQPELHIHPAVQCALGDVLARQVVGSGERTLILETHSEHLMLRLLRRIRERFEGELPPGAPEISPSELSVLYVEKVDGTVRITELPVTEDGDFAKNWPKGFFEERAEELF